MIGRPLGQKLHQGDAGREQEPGERADIRDEGEEAGEQADQHAEIQPDRPQPNGVERAEDEADEALAADEARDRAVDLAGELAHGEAVARRHPAVEGRDHAVPVDQKIERHHRRHHEERHEADDRLAAGPQRAQERQHPGDRLPHQVADRGLQVLHRLAAARALDQRPGMLGNDRLKLGDRRRHRGDQRRDLVGGQRHRDDQHDDEQEQEHRQDDEGRGEPPDPEALQPVGDRVEHVGQGRAGHEGQQHVAQEVEQQRQDCEGKQGNRHPALDRHRLSPALAVPGDREPAPYGQGGGSVEPVR